MIFRLVFWKFRCPNSEGALGDEIQLHAVENELKETKVEAKLLHKKMVDGTTTLRFELSSKQDISWDSLKSLFVYGKKVDDFRMVKYEKLYMLNVSVTQQLMKENDALKKATEEDRKRLREQEETNKKQQKRLDKLEKMLRKLWNKK